VTNFLDMLLHGASASSHLVNHVVCWYLAS